MHEVGFFARVYTLAEAPLYQKCCEGLQLLQQIPEDQRGGFRARLVSAASIMKDVPEAGLSSQEVAKAQLIVDELRELAGSAA